MVFVEVTLIIRKLLIMGRIDLDVRAEKIQNSSIEAFEKSYPLSGNSGPKRLVWWKPSKNSKRFLTTRKAEFSIGILNKHLKSSNAK